MIAGDAGTMELSVALPFVPGKLPRLLGYIKNFSFHIWDHVLERFVRLRAAQYGIPRCTVMDAKLHLHTQLEVLDALIVTPVPETETDEIITRVRNAHVPTGDPFVKTQRMMMQSRKPSQPPPSRTTRATGGLRHLNAGSRAFGGMPADQPVLKKPP